MARSPALSARVAGDSNRVAVRELRKEEGRVHADVAGKPQGRELDAWKQYAVFLPVEFGAQPKDNVDARQVLTWKEAKGKKTARARVVTQGHQNPDL